MVLLDEPTTGLDLQTESVVLKGLSHWSRGRTMVVVTHRLQVLNIVDRIVVMNEGRVMMDGPRDEILKNCQGNSRVKRADRQLPERQPDKKKSRYV
nr:hypothetical protein [Escherichia coli]